MARKKRRRGISKKKHSHKRWSRSFKQPNPIYNIDRFKKVKAVIFFTFLVGLIKIAYPYYIDYSEGKWGGRLQLKVLSSDLPENELVYLFYSIPNESRSEKFVIPVQLGVVNTSNVADTDVTLSLKYDRKSNRSALSEEFMVHSGRIFSDEIRHEINNSKEYGYSNYQYKSMPPGAGFNITDAAFSSKIDYGDDFPVLFSTGTGLDVDVTTESTRDAEREWRLRFRGVNVTDEKGLEWWVRNWYGKHVALETRESSSVLEYLIGIIMSKTITIYGFSPEFRKAVGVDLYIPENDVKNYTGFKFSPYVWGLL